MNKMILFSFVMLVFSPTESHTMAHELMARVPDIINAVSGRASIDRQTNDEYTKVLEAISASLETVVTEKDCLNQTLNLTLIDEKDKNKALLSQIDELNETLEQVIVGNEELYKDKKKLVEELAKVTVAKENIKIRKSL